MLPGPQVALIHLWQAALFTDRGAVTAVGPTGGIAAVVPRMRSASGAWRLHAGLAWLVPCATALLAGLTE